MPSNFSVSVTGGQGDNQQEHPIVIDDDMDSLSSDHDVEDADVEDADSNHSEDDSDEFVEALDRMSEEEQVENNFEQERDLLQRQKQAFEEDKVKVQQQQQALWEEQKVKEEELRKKEEELKKQEKEMAVELEKKKEEIDRKAQETQNLLKNQQNSSKNKLVINKDEVIIDEGIDNKKNTTVIKDQGDLSDPTKEVTTTNIDADMIEAPKKKVLPQVPTLEHIAGTVPKWPFTFTMSAKGSASSSTTPSTVSGTTADRQEQEEIEDLVQQVTRHHQGSKRRVFRPTIPSRKRGKSVSERQ